MKVWPKRILNTVLITFLISSNEAIALPEPIESLKAKGAEVIESFDAPDGFTGYELRFQGNRLTAYLTPDGEHVLVGTMIDREGQEVEIETTDGFPTIGATKNGLNGRYECAMVSLTSSRNGHTEQISNPWRNPLVFHLNGETGSFTNASNNVQSVELVHDEKVEGGYVAKYSVTTLPENWTKSEFYFTFYDNGDPTGFGWYFEPPIVGGTLGAGGCR